MSHFYGTLQGNRSKATRGGIASSGMTSYTASWSGAVKVEAFLKKFGVCAECGKPQAEHKDKRTDGHKYMEQMRDWVRVELVPWQGSGTNKVLYMGPIGVYEPTQEKEVL